MVLFVFAFFMDEWDCSQDCVQVHTRSLLGYLTKTAEHCNLLIQMLAMFKRVNRSPEGVAEKKISVGAQWQQRPRSAQAQWKNSRVTV